ncbi:MAG TPA: vitamin K epoxide reductase family protein [Desulfomonilaceae bacterium]|nr:vitamin K epoxide reductase family protein [Desulfomonilaceae bacterium]
MPDKHGQETRPVARFTWLRRKSRPVYPGTIPEGVPYFVGPRPFVLLLILALVGTFATGFLTYRHVVLASQTAQVGDSALCRADGTVNCDGILITDYAVLFGYFPSSVLGLVGFTFVLWMVVNALVNERIRKVSWVGLVLYFFAAIGFSWYYVYIMAFEVDYICTWCIVVHVVNLLSLILVIIVSVKKKNEFLLPEIASKAERIYFVAGGILLSCFVFFVSMSAEKALSFENAKTKYEDLANDPVVITALLKGSPTYEVAMSSGDPVFGNPAAPYPIFFFSDFQCPVCPKVEHELRAIVALNPDALCLVYKNFPLSTDCNASLVGNLHPVACAAARAAYAAFLLKGADAFWAYGDLLFANQKQLKTAPWSEFAAKIGLNTTKFDRLMSPDSPAAMKVKEDTELGAKLKLAATPQIFFQGKNLPQAFKGEFFVDALEELVKARHPEKTDFRLRHR